MTKRKECREWRKRRFEEVMAENFSGLKKNNNNTITHKIKSSILAKYKAQFESSSVCIFEKLENEHPFLASTILYRCKWHQPHSGVQMPRCKLSAELGLRGDTQTGAQALLHSPLRNLPFFHPMHLIPEKEAVLISLKHIPLGSAVSRHTQKQPVLPKAV